MRSTITVNGTIYNVRKGGDRYLIDVNSKYLIEIFEATNTGKGDHTFWRGCIWERTNCFGDKHLVGNITSTRGLVRRRTAHEMARVALIDFAK